MVALFIVSGGQTGVDRGALDAAIELGIEHGGFCPRGRRAEDGVIPDRYQLVETQSSSYPQRTRANVIHSDGTLILTRGPLSGGTALTAKLAGDNHRPLRIVDLATPDDHAAICHWLTSESITRLNVAGPRESNSPGIALAARDYLIEVLAPAVGPK